MHSRFRTHRVPRLIVEGAGTTSRHQLARERLRELRLRKYEQALVQHVFAAMQRAMESS